MRRQWYVEDDDDDPRRLWAIRWQSIAYSLGYVFLSVSSAGVCARIASYRCGEKDSRSSSFSVRIDDADSAIVTSRHNDRIHSHS
jgi:hypothetical protein